MKNLIFITLLLLFASCDKPTFENSIENPKKFTTVELQELAKDTIIVTYDGTTLYQFDENNLIQKRFELTKSFFSVSGIDSDFLLFALGFIFGAIIFYPFD